MQKTLNYGLPQWEAHDPMRRTDFNEAMANIDAKAAQVEAVSIDTTDFVAGDTIYTFAMPPKFVILRGVYVTFFVLQGGTGEGMDYPTVNEGRTVVFQLDGTALIMTERTDTRAAATLIITAFF